MFLLRNVRCMKMSVTIWQTGKKWNASNGTENATGNSPKAAIAILFAKIPELEGSEITYDLVKSTDIIQDAFVCPICKKRVNYVKGKKPNGRIGVMVLHEGEVGPVDATVVGEGDITREYMLWLLERAHEVPKIPKVTKQPDETALVTIGSTMEVPTTAADKKEEIKKKIKVILRKEDVAAKKLPNVDISQSKRNRFVIVSSVIKAMTAAGAGEEELKSARTEMTQGIKGFVDFVNVASQYAKLYDMN
jgi:hypothetical protein